MPRSSLHDRPGAPPRLPRVSGTVVMKFGGTSVADPEKIKSVARRLVAAREAGNRVVAVLSAMGKTTDDLVSLAADVSPTPDPREIDQALVLPLKALPDKEQQYCKDNKIAEEWEVYDEAGMWRQLGVHPPGTGD